MKPMREIPRDGLPGLVAVVVGLVLLAGAGSAFAGGASAKDATQVGVAAVLFVAAGLVFGGLATVNPNEAVVLQLFGSYAGTLRTAGLRWTNPFYTKKRISVRVSNFDSERLKVNDRDGNPIEIAAIVVMRVRDTAQASFQVNDYMKFVRVQAEAALRSLASRYPYDAHDDMTSLRAHTDDMAEELRNELSEHVAQAGVEILDAKISHLAYAPEIAHAMLQRQQAGAIVAARQRIVEGAVGMVEMALGMLAKQNIVDLDEERKAAMVSNLLVVLCGERSTQPVVNTGTIYQ